MSWVAPRPRSDLPPVLSNQLDEHGDILPKPPDLAHQNCSDTFIVATLRSACLACIAHSSCYHSDEKSLSLLTERSFFMDMLWMFMGVMGVLLIAGLVVYKKSA